MQPLAKQGAVEASSDTNAGKHEGIADLGDSGKNPGDVAQQLEAQRDRAELAGALTSPIEQDLWDPGQVKNRDGADLQRHEDGHGHELRVEQDERGGVEQGAGDGGAARQALEVDDEAHEQDVLEHDEDRLAVRREGECAARKVDGREGGAHGLQRVHQDRDAGGGAAAHDADDLRDLVQHAADEDAHAHDGRQERQQRARRRRRERWRRRRERWRRRGRWRRGCRAGGRGGARGGVRGAPRGEAPRGEAPQTRTGRRAQT